MRNTISLGLLIMVMISGCHAPGNMIQTLPLNPGDTSRLNGFVYALPQTVFRIDVEVVKTRVIRGPYYRFAEKYLSIRDVPQRNETRWHIDRVQLHTLREADPEHRFLVRQVTGETDLSPWLQLTEAGLLAEFSAEEVSAMHLAAAGLEAEGPVYTDLSTMPNIVESEDNLFKTILTDSTFIQVPVTTQQLIVRTIDEKAREAADVILEIRRNRIDALGGKGSTVPGAAAIRRMDSLEREYLSLFVGKQLTTRLKQTYFVTPEGLENFENMEILEFSTSRGIMRERGGDSEVLSLTCQKPDQSPATYQPDMEITSLSNALYYRIPAQVMVRVNLGEENLISRRIPVFQYGSILSLPVSEGSRRKTGF